METFAVYLLKSVIWLAGFALIFILFLRNERFFVLNRIYLLAGIITSFIFPMISIHYTVVLPVVRNIQIENAIMSEIQNPDKSLIPDLKLILSVLYVLGVAFVLTLIIRQGRSVFRAIKKSEIISFHPAKLIKTPEYTTAFSFFSYVFVNPSVTDVETKEIMIHELVHIRQKHWFDLLLVELLCMMQWFNPLVWIYIRFIRQNHEYLADEVALQQTSDPAVYRAVLLNQIVGAPVVNLANSFNYSPNKKRFNMMKNIISSPYRKMKILFILPVFAIVLYAFAKPDYKYKYADQSSGDNVSGTSLQQKSVKGTIVQNDGTPMPGATILIKGTTLGTSADATGSFKIDNVPDNGLIVVSFVGFKSKVLKPVFTSEMAITMVRDTVRYNNLNISSPPPPPPPMNAAGDLNAPPPPPPPPASGIDLKGDGPQPLYVVDGSITSKAEVEKIDPETIESIHIFKDESVSAKYGEKGENGVIELYLKKATSTLITEDGSKDTVKVSAYGGMHFKTSENKAVPLYVIDGVIASVDDLNKVDPQTFVLVNILKDGAAISKYGERGKDGAIEITTKNYNSVGTGGGVTGVKILRDSFTPLPPPSYVKIRSKDGKTPLVVVDGVAKDIEVDKIDPKTVASMNVLSDEFATNKYGEKAKDGVVEFTTYNKGEKRPDTDKDVFVVVEELPQFIGGNEAMIAWITSNLKYPSEAVKAKITGEVYVNFMVSKTGKVKNVVVSKSASPLLNAEAIRVISSMPDWKPGSQAGKLVDVQMQVPVEFKLK
jgi:TonB family protein